MELNQSPADEENSRTIHRAEPEGHITHEMCQKSFLLNNTLWTYNEGFVDAGLGGSVRWDAYTRATTE